MTPDAGLTALEGWVWFMAILALLIGGFALVGWWQLRGRP